MKSTKTFLTLKKKKKKKKKNAVKRSVIVVNNAECLKLLNAFYLEMLESAYNPSKFLFTQRIKGLANAILIVFFA